MARLSVEEKHYRPNCGLLHDVYLRIIKAWNLALITLPVALCWLIYYADRAGMRSCYQSISIILMYAALYFFFGRVYDAFYVSLKRISELFYSQLLGILMSDGFMFLILCLLNGRIPNIVPALLGLVCQVLLSIGWCYFSHLWYFSRFAGQRTGIIYDARHDIESLFGKYGLDRKFDVMFTCRVEECLEQNMKALSDLDAVFLCGIHSHDRNVILKYCVAHGIMVYVIPRVGDVLLSGANRMHMFHLPMLRVGRYNPPIEYVVAKRVFDIVSSLIAIMITCPVMFIVAVAIKVHDGGPVLYKQTRLTKDGKLFTLYKFRSMKVDAEKDGVAQMSTGENDDRITPIGRKIRAYRLDELPQLFNILSGSMSVVGPRPERPEFAKQYEKSMPEFSLRLQTKAGLTGYAQVYGKYNTQPYDKLQMDLMYIAKPSFVEDLRIVFATILILFAKESSEGVSTETNEMMRHAIEVDSKEIDRKAAS